MATSVRKESPGMAKSGAKKKSRPKAKFTIFDFISDDESDSTREVGKTVGKGTKKAVKKAPKKTKDSPAGLSSDGNQLSDSEYSSQDSQVRASAAKPKTESAKKTKAKLASGKQKGDSKDLAGDSKMQMGAAKPKTESAKKTKPKPASGKQKGDSKYLAEDSKMQMSAVKKTKLTEKTKPVAVRQKTPMKTEIEICLTKVEIAPAVSIKRKASGTTLKASSPKKPRVEPLTTPSPGRPRVTRSGRLTRSTYRAAALWGEDMEVESASAKSRQPEGGMDVEDPFGVETTRSVCVSKEGEGGGMERDDGGQQESGEKEEPSQSGEDLHEKGGKGDIVSGFDVLDSDKPSEGSPMEQSSDEPGEPRASPVQPPLDEVDKLVSDAGKAVPDTTSTDTTLKSEEGETTIAEHPVEQMNRTPSPKLVSSPSQPDADKQVSRPRESTLYSPRPNFPTEDKSHNLCIDVNVVHCRSCLYHRHNLQVKLVAGSGC